MQWTLLLPKVQLQTAKTRTFTVEDQPVRCPSFRLYTSSRCLARLRRQSRKYLHTVLIDAEATQTCILGRTHTSIPHSQAYAYKGYHSSVEERYCALGGAGGATSAYLIPQARREVAAFLQAKGLMRASRHKTG